MSQLQLNEFELHEVLFTGEFYSIHKATQPDVAGTFRLTLVDPEVSTSTAFRAAFRKDETSLANVHHENIPSLMAWGERDGQLFFVTEAVDGRSLRDRLDSGQAFELDELTDIAWQVASALQYAHNVGLCHGGISSDSVIVSDELRVALPEFGLHAWRREATPNHRHSFALAASEDLAALGRLWKSSVQSLTDELSNTPELTRKVSRILSILERPVEELTAREVQGRLGDVLLTMSGESIEMVDHREGQQLSRRSIVDELFDAPIRAGVSVPEEAAAVQDDGASRRLKIAVGLGVVILLIWLLAR